MPITLRNTKGSELTFAELDGNFTHLETQVNTLTDSSTVKTFIDTTYVQGIADQTYIEGIVDSAYVNNRAEVSVALIDSDYVQARVDTVKLYPYSRYRTNIWN